jgi:hypothetical protein
MEALVTGGAVGPTTPGDDLVFTKGVGKFLIVVNTDAGDDYVGDITVTGDSVDRETGAVTTTDTDTLTINGVSTDTTTTDNDGHQIHSSSSMTQRARSPWKPLMPASARWAAHLSLQLICLQSTRALEIRVT